MLLVAAAVLTLLFQRAEGQAFHLPGGDGGVITAAGLWTCALIIWRIFDKQGGTAHGQHATTYGIEWGIFVALAVAACSPTPARGSGPPTARAPAAGRDDPAPAPRSDVPPPADRRRPRRPCVTAASARRPRPRRAIASSRRDHRPVEIVRRDRPSASPRRRSQPDGPAPTRAATGERRIVRPPAPAASRDPRAPTRRRTDPTLPGA